MVKQNFIYIFLDYDFGGLEKINLEANEVKTYNKNEDILFTTNSEKGFYVLDIQDLYNIQILSFFNITGDVDHI